MCLYVSYTHAHFHTHEFFSSIYKIEDKNTHGRFGLNASIALWIKFIDPNLQKMIEADKVRINFANSIEIDVIVQIGVLFSFLGKEAYYRISLCLMCSNSMKW